MLTEPLDFCAINQAIREAESIERLNQLGKIIKREIELGFSWTLCPENVAFMRKEWQARRKSIEQQRGSFYVKRRRYVTDRFEVR